MELYRKFAVKLADRRGSVLMEAAVCLPVLLVMILGCMQIAHIWFARQVVQYAAYASARTLLVTPDQDYAKAVQVGGEAWKAAANVCSWVALSQPQGAGKFEIPGWGGVPGSGGLEEKLELSLGQSGSSWNPKVTVTFDFPLVMPIAGPIIGWGVNPWADNREWSVQHQDATGDKHSGDAVKYPYIRFRESAALTKPYILEPFSAGGGL